MVASKIKYCTLCKKGYDKLFKPNEKVLGTQLSSSIKQVLGDQQIVFPQKFLICTECSLAIIQSEIILKRLAEVVSNNEIKKQEAVVNKSATQIEVNPASDVPEKKEEKDDLGSSMVPEKEKDIAVADQTNVDWTFNCIHCDYTTTEAKLYKNHLTTKHNLDNPRIYQCMYCPESYQRVNGIQNHITYVHEHKPRPPRQRRKTITLEAPPLMSSTTIEEQPKTPIVKKESDKDVANDAKTPYLFACDKCKYETINAKVFKRHLKTKHEVEDGKIYKCQKCTSTYARQFALQNHIAYKHDNKPRPKPQRRKSVPPELELSTTTANDLLGLVGAVEHVEESDEFKCSLCPYRTDNDKSLKNHLVIKHQIDNINQNGGLLENENGNDDDDGNLFKIPQESSLNRTNSNEISNEWVFRCSHCDFESNKRKTYKSHIRNTHGMNDEDIYKCIYCAGAYKRYNLLQSHVTNKHSIDLTNISDTPAAFSDSNTEDFKESGAKKRKIGSKSNTTKASEDADTSVEQAVKKHKVEEGKTFKEKEACVVCGKKFSSVEKLRAHMDKHHGGDQLKKCANCDAQFRSIEKYETHLFGEKCIATKMACQYQGCAKRFTNPSKMKQHMREKHPDLIS